jgi:N-acetylglucosaminyldiphosphoundecaprenol N-acetyl-beta-D-mannosaminyltransferase
VTTADVLGFPIVCGSVEGTRNELCRWVASGHRGFVCLVNVHMLETARASARVRMVLAEADLLLPDGAPLAWAAGRERPAARVTGADLFDAMLRASRALGLRNYLFGTTDETLVRLEQSIEARYGRDLVCGSHAPGLLDPEQPVRNADIDRIAAARPDIVWVGLGAPKQELWMQLARAKLEAPVLVGVGAAFDFFAGTKRRAPGWMRDAGLEWLYRLAQEPRRLGGRYLRTNTTFAAALARNTIRRRFA